jgi:predicted transposase YdaD
MVQTATERFIADRDAQQAYALKLGREERERELLIEHSRNALAQGLEVEMVHRITGLPLADVLTLQAGTTKR